MATPLTKVYDSFESKILEDHCAGDCHLHSDYICSIRRDLEAAHL